jgi:FkbM family methyltransferase
MENPFMHYEIPSSLPNGLPIFQPNELQTRLLYQEIFQEEIYLKHGIVVSENPCVFDVGANIGLFSIFIHHKCKGAMIYAFEPIPSTFKLLQSNINLHRINAKIFDYGLSRCNQIRAFIFYPKLHAFSGCYADSESDQSFLELFRENWLQSYHDTSFVLYMEELLKDYLFQSETYQCRLKTLSEVIDEYNVKQIDLLKIDVERSEVDVLTGINEEDWPKIKQIVVEAHSYELANVTTTILEKHGYDVIVNYQSAPQGWEPCSMIYGVLT